MWWLTFLSLLFWEQTLVCPMLSLFIFDFGFLSLPFCNIMIWYPGLTEGWWVQYKVVCSREWAEWICRAWAVPHFCLLWELPKKCNVADFITCSDLVSGVNFIFFVLKTMLLNVAQESCMVGRHQCMLSCVITINLLLLQHLPYVLLSNVLVLTQNQPWKHCKSKKGEIPLDKVL